MLFNKLARDILVVTPVFLKSLNLVKMAQLVVFDMVEDTRDFLRVLSKFAKKGEQTENFENRCYLFFEKGESEKMKLLKNYLSLQEV